jgi:hypothetical protein
MDDVARFGLQGLPSLLRDGDELEQKTWEEMRHYLGLYETIWGIFSVPLRRESSIYFRAASTPILKPWPCATTPLTSTWCGR